jgi:hypothetical protein
MTAYNTIHTQIVRYVLDACEHFKLNLQCISCTLFHTIGSVFGDDGTVFRCNYRFMNEPEGDSHFFIYLTDTSYTYEDIFYCVDRSIQNARLLSEK